MFKSFRKKIQSLDKNKQNILTAVFILIDFFIIIFMIIFWGRSKKVAPEIVVEKSGKSTEEQLKELNSLMKDVTPLTEEEKKQHLMELEELQKKTEPLTPEQVQQQLEELNKLHKSQ